eukprot:6181471-Pyramimonas_sp.AAC.1
MMKLKKWPALSTTTATITTTTSTTTTTVDTTTSSAAAAAEEEVEVAVAATTTAAAEYTLAPLVSAPPRPSPDRVAAGCSPATSPPRSPAPPPLRLV